MRKSAATDSRDPVELDRLARGAVSGYQAVVNHLRREIILGRIRPGDRLPPERKLAEHLGVARETLRQGLRVLEGSGQILVSRGARGGATVQESIIDPVLVREDLEIRKEYILQLIEFRSVIESGAAGLAALRRGDAELELMALAQQALLNSTSTYEARMADTAFHLAVAKASGNPALLASIEDARVQMFSPLDVMAFHFEREVSYNAHQKILEAIERGDADAASQSMKEHLSTTKIEFEALCASTQ